MAFQTAITRSPAAAFEGMLADSNHVDVVSKLAKTTTAPGRAVRLDTADTFEQASVPSAAAQVTGDATTAPCIGVTFGDVTALTNPYVAGDPMPVLRKGEVWVIREDAGDHSTPVYIRHTANGGNTVIGGFAGAAGTGLSLAPVGYRWMTKTTATNSLAILSVNLP
jgi:hypothetical protein